MSMSFHICDGMDSFRCIERLIREMTLIRMKGYYNNYKPTHISCKILSDKLTRDFFIKSKSLIKISYTS